MSIPVSSPLGFIGIFLLAFGLFLILTGFDIITIQQVSVRKGPKTWALGIGILLLGGILIFPEISNQFTSMDPVTSNDDVIQTVDQNNSGEDENSTGENEQTQLEEQPDWRPLVFNIPNDGIWSQPSDSSYFASDGLTDSFAWSDEVVSGDFKLRMDVKSDFGNYGEGMVIVYGEGQTWSMGSLIFNITGYWQGIRSGTIYGDDTWLVYNERHLFEKEYTMLIEVTGNVAYLYADDLLVASITLPSDSRRSGQIGLVKYWESADVTFSDIEILIP